MLFFAIIMMTIDAIVMSIDAIIVNIDIILALFFSATPGPDAGATHMA